MFWFKKCSTIFFSNQIKKKKIEIVMATNDYNELPKKWILFIIAQKYKFLKVWNNAFLFCQLLQIFKKVSMVSLKHCTSYFCLFNVDSLLTSVIR